MTHQHRPTSKIPTQIQNDLELLGVYEAAINSSQKRPTEEEYSEAKNLIQFYYCR